MACGPAGGPRETQTPCHTPSPDPEHNPWSASFEPGSAAMATLADDGGKRWPGAGLSTSPCLTYLNPMEIPRLPLFYR